MNANVTTAAPVGNQSTGPIAKANTQPTNGTQQPTKGTPTDGTVGTDGKQAVVENPFKGTKHKVKFNGEDLEVDYADLVSDYQVKKASINKMNDATKLDEKARDVLKRFSAKDKEAFKQVGVDPYEWAEQLVQEKIENELLTPEQRERKELLAKIASYEQDKKSAETAKQEAEFQKAYNFHAQDLDLKFTAALKDAKVPKTTATVRRMADYMMKFANAGQNVEPADVIQYVKQDYMEEHQQLWGESDLDQLYEQFGKTNIDKLIKAHNAKMSKADPTPSRQRAPGAKPSSKAKKGPRSAESVFKSIRERYS